MKPRKKPITDPVDKLLKRHNDYCNYWVFSGDRHCTCGRDAAIEQIANLRQIAVLAQWLTSRQMLQLNFWK